MIENTKYQELINNLGIKDWNQWLVVGDWLEEQGDLNLSYAYRYCSIKQKCPLLRQDKIRLPWNWIKRIGPHQLKHKSLLHVKLASDYPTCVLPTTLFTLLPNKGKKIYSSKIYSYENFNDCMQSLSVGLVLLRTDYDIWFQNNEK